MRRRTFMKATTAAGVTSGVLGLGNTHAAVDTPPIVSVAGSDDPALTAPAPLDADLTTDQVQEEVWLALDRDTSTHRLTNIVDRDSWVVIKPNIVTCPVDHGPFKAEGLDHWWLVTDLRVVRAVAAYLIERVGPRRITIAEGPVWQSSGGSLNPAEFLDGWHCTWKGFGGLSYAGIAEELDAVLPDTTVDIVDLNEDDAVYVENFDPRGSGVQALQWVAPGDPDGTSSDDWTHRRGIWLPRTIMERDVLITVPVLKTHSSAGVTLCFKNFVGCVHSRTYGDGTSKRKIHQGSQLGLLRGIADLGCAIDPDYAVTEGFHATVQQHLGQNGVGIRHNVVAAGADVVAVEAVSMQLMGYNPIDYDLLRWMRTKGIGEFDPASIEVTGPPVASIARNYGRAVNTYFARGVRHWRVRGPQRREIESPEALDPGPGDTGWTYLDGDALIDAAVNDAPPVRLKDCLYYELPGSRGARSGSRWYLGVRAMTERRDLVGHLLAGCRGGDVRAFFNGRTINYPDEPMPYDPTPMPYLKFIAGTNRLVVEITKTANRNKPVTFAANLCDLDGDRLADITLDPEAT
jgi:hypothetical protein